MFEWLHGARDGGPPATDHVTTTLGPLAGALLATVITMLAREGELWRRGKRTDWLRVLGGVPSALMMLIVGAGVSEWLGLGPKATWACCAIFTWIGPYGMRELVGRYVLAKVMPALPDGQKVDGAHGQ